ncbi:MAG: endonuclease/exonuclease/phosphatase family protein [Acidimicrobiia bacterium]
MPTRVLTWNLQGRERPDLDAVADVVRAAHADVVALQEVQRRQARRLAAGLGWWVDWRFKHWSIVVPPEGLALLAPAPLAEVERAHLAHRWRFWSHRRRIAVAGTLGTAEGRLRVVGTHLGAGVGDDERVRQARLTVGAVDGTGAVVGDLNTHPGSTVLGAYAEAGLRDAWDDARPGEPGPTNWRPGPRDAAPTQRLDYVLVTDDLEVVAAELPAAGEPGFGRFGELSDHLPLLAELRRR